MASGAIQHGHARSFEPATRSATVTQGSRAAEVDCDEEVGLRETVSLARETLGGARGAMVALTVETVAALCLFGAWEILRFLR